jgi:uncharacterized membrane protein YccC
VLRTQRPLYARDLMADKASAAADPALKSYLSLKSPALRNAGRISVMLSIASLMGSALHLPKPYWILMTCCSSRKTATAQPGYVSPPGSRDARRAGHCRRHAALSRSGRLYAGRMLLITLVSYLIIRKNYGWAMVGFTVTAVYTLQLLTLNGEQFIVPGLSIR